MPVVGRSARANYNANIAAILKIIHILRHAKDETVNVSGSLIIPVRSTPFKRKLNATLAKLRGGASLGLYKTNPVENVNYCLTQVVR